MRALVETLCSDSCAGRAAGTVGGMAARAAIVGALRAARLDPMEQVVSGCGGANVLATIAGDVERYVLVSAHYDHLGSFGSRIYRGADDNAAAVAVLVEVARALKSHRPRGRGVIIAVFDSEEPPYFMTAAMGSEHFARHPIVPLDRIDLMIGMDLIGHRVGSGAKLSAEVSESLFALGAERSAGTSEEVEALSQSVPGVRIRSIDAEIIPPLSDYHAFWMRAVPFLFLTAGRSRYYHTVDDTPQTLDWPKMAATARWLERLVRSTCARAEDRIAFISGKRNDRSTLRALLEVTDALRTTHPEAETHYNTATRLLAQCDRAGRLPDLMHPLTTLSLAALEKLIE